MPSSLLMKKITLLLLYAGYVTFYNPVGKRLSCLRPMGEPKEQWNWDGEREGVAHRWLPCGSEVYIKIGDRVVRTQVLDRGPYMAVDQKGKWHVASPPKMKKYWKKKLASQGENPTDDKLKKLSWTLPPGWKWRSAVDILWSLKPKLGTKGGRQPGQVLVTPELWEQVREERPDNDAIILPGQDPG